MITARFFASEWKRRQIREITGPDLVAEFLMAKKQDNLSKRYLDDSRLRLKKFKGHIQLIGSRNLDDYLRGLIGILTPDEFAAALGFATRKTLPAFVLGGFCGMRQAEICRLDWSAIDFTRNLITVNADIAKASGPVIESSSPINLSIMMRPVWEAAKAKRSQNASAIPAHPTASPPPATHHKPRSNSAPRSKRKGKEEKGLPS